MTTAVPIHIKTSGDSGIRPVDPMRDLSAIVKLIEVGFRDELDPQGQKMLKQMQRIARRSPWLRMFMGPPYEPTGFVWVESKQVIGNLSLRKGAPASKGGWLIGNVVVHPDYRGQHIGYGLMETAIETAAKRGARWIGLEVREDNDIAGRLYRQLGFKTVGTLHHLIRPGAKLSVQVTHNIETEPSGWWRLSKPKDNSRWMRLAKACYEPQQRAVLEIRSGIYTFGRIGRKLELWFQGQHEQAWIAESDQLRAALCVRTDRRHHFNLWDILVHPDMGTLGAQRAVIKALNVTGSALNWPVVMLAPPNPGLINVLNAVGFQPHRTLVQMVLQL
jgi:ribosomal protein S18 acetylase RimI-like enzyme